MINPDALLTDLKRWVLRLEDDLRERCREYPEVDGFFREAYKSAKEADRTAHPYQTWLDQELTQVAVGWVLASVFVRFLEDNGLIDAPWLSGPGERRDHAGEVRATYFREHPHKADNDYLLHVFTEVGRLPGMADLFDRRHNSLWAAKISGDAAAALIEFWRRIDGASGDLVHDFSDPEWNTRFLGDLYQNLSEEAQKRFALLQTPEFVEEFILDRTLDPAIASFGYKVVRLIDPACGSGHFLLGAFRRLLALWRKGDATLSAKEVARLALEAVHGVDLNPFAIAIARFRLLLEAWRYAGVTRLKGAPDFRVKLAVGDSLLHSASFSREGKAEDVGQQLEFDTGGDFRDTLRHYYDTEDRTLLRQILGRQYHAVVANPPYITVKDKALNQLYRQRFPSCHRKYSLAVPFMELIFELAIEGDPRERKASGHTGQITANSFMKREFGKKLVEKYLPRWDLTHVIDTSGCYIPGHGTPTVILFGRHQRPHGKTIRSVFGIKGEPSTPKDPAKGLVWSAILDQVDRPGSESEFVSTTDSEREKFYQHPWSIGGGGAAELKTQIGHETKSMLDKIINSIGFGSILGEDDAYMRPSGHRSLVLVDSNYRRPIIGGEEIRDFSLNPSTDVLFPYSDEIELITNHILISEIWNFRCLLEARNDFSGLTYKDKGRKWWEFHQIPIERNKTPLSITFAFVATHNHFVLDRGGKVFNRTAPVIKLPEGASEAEHLQLLGLLNSSTACFWGRETLFSRRGDPVGRWGEFVEWDGTKLQQFPIPAKKPDVLPTQIDALAQKLSATSPSEILIQWASNPGTLADTLAASETEAASIRGRMIALQEELDWQCYRLYGLIEPKEALEWPEDRLDELPELSLGERAFEIDLARRVAAGELETSWFERHKQAGSRPVTKMPSHWPQDYRDLVDRRLRAMEENKSLNLIERPEYKRRWNTEPWAKQQETALRQWLLTRLEAYFYDADRMVEGEDEEARQTLLTYLQAMRRAFPSGQGLTLCSTRQLAEAAQIDSQWMEAAQLYTSNPAFDVPKLVRELVEKEAVPYLPTQRYKAPGLRKRAQWETTWELQRREDAVEARVRKDNPNASGEELKTLIRAAHKAEVGDIAVPPKYKSGDFKKTAYWALRGKLDVPKERWIFYPGAERSGDPSPVIAWAGWNHLQQVQALGAWYYERQSNDGWEAPSLLPLLSGIKDLLPWVRQWHAGIHPEFGQDLGEFYEGFLRTQCHELGLTDADVEKERIGE